MLDGSIAHPTCEQMQGASDPAQESYPILVVRNEKDDYLQKFMTLLHLRPIDRPARSILNI